MLLLLRVLFFVGGRKFRHVRACLQYYPVKCYEINKEIIANKEQKKKNKGSKLKFSTLLN